MIYFARGNYDGPGAIRFTRTPPGRGSRRLLGWQFADELAAETAPAVPVICRPVPPVHSAIVLWLRAEGCTVAELGEGEAPECHKAA